MCRGVALRPFSFFSPSLLVSYSWLCSMHLHRIANFAQFRQKNAMHCKSLCFTLYALQQIFVTFHDGIKQQYVLDWLMEQTAQ